MVDENGNEITETVIEPPAEAATETEAPKEEPKGLSLDDALKAAIEKHQPKEVTNGAPEPKAKAAGDSKVREPKEAAAGEAETEAPKVEAPQEFNAREREAWSKGDQKGIVDGMRRVLKDRQAEVSRVHNEYAPYKQLVQTVEPYLRAAGNTGKPPAQAITEALAVVNSLQSDPVGTAREIIRIAKLKPEQLFGEARNVPPAPEIVALQSQVQSLTSTLEQRQTQDLGRQYGAVFEGMNADGKYPDINESEEGHRIAAQIGTLTRNPVFVGNVRAINPGAGLRELCIEAYKHLGGRIVEPQNQVSSQPKVQHIEKARRASASQPGRAPASAKAPPQKKFSDLGSALKAALEYHSE